MPPRWRCGCVSCPRPSRKKPVITSYSIHYTKLYEVPLADAEGQRFGLRGGHIQAAEQPVPQGEVDAEVAVEVPGIRAVVDLVLGRAAKHMFDDRAEREPDMGMAQVGPQAVEQQHHIADAEQAEGVDPAPCGIEEGAASYNFV